MLNMFFFFASFLLHVAVSVFMALAFVRSLNRLTDVRGCLIDCDWRIWVGLGWDGMRGPASVGPNGRIQTCKLEPIHPLPISLP